MAQATLVAPWLVGGKLHYSDKSNDETARLCDVVDATATNDAATRLLLQIQQLTA